ncbi:hypothetical protein B0H67DRAFT_553820 [Lasiosphaeris hirsuta]|uniref:Uncharacterized protein n=1 Tax=Lasiosphaeris hirsuta TaxID=260670 RepID=A0AA40AG52_9PEZI|nr:hypothetical protein B0H67DRAFT_553820 [Lasiosphaeris hirsuta]
MVDTGNGKAAVGGRPVHDVPARHYPVDIPNAPFDRYEHRRLTAQDILVHRIMADFMNPSRVTPGTYCAYLKKPPNFNPISMQDKELGGDLRLLQKLIFTSYAHQPPGKRDTLKIPKQDVRGWLPAGRITVEGPHNKPATIADQVLDTVMRFYFEVDDATLRAWITRSGPLRNNDGPRLHDGVPPWRSRRLAGLTRQHAAVMYFNTSSNLETNRDCAPFSPTDRGALGKLAPKVHLQDYFLLYDGGAFLPYLRRGMDKSAGALNGTSRRLKRGHWTADEPRHHAVYTPVWPERRGDGMRFIMQSPWGDRDLDEHSLRQPYYWKLDLCLNPSRGRNRDGIWSTGQYPAAEKWKDEGGRYGRPRRRCGSEPPPGSFAAADFPLPSKFEIMARMEILYPRMTLRELDRRSRRRSLSRTRIEDMFDWNIDLVDIGASSTPPLRETVSPISGPALTSTEGQSSTMPQYEPRCENCADRTHHTTGCTSPCGHCGAPNPSQRHLTVLKSLEPDNNIGEYMWNHPTIPISNFYPNPDPNPDDEPPRPGQHHHPHTAPNCPVKRENRCKCVSFPTFHTAEHCGIPCRRCGGGDGKGVAANHAPGTYQHRTAMLCRRRCCMCGLRGHSGRECRFRQCRCGGAHLGQDCTWKPTCRVPGCDRFLCGVHCRDCGNEEKPFVQGKCWRCLGMEAPPVSSEGSRRRGRGRERRKGEKAVGSGGPGDPANRVVSSNPSEGEPGQDQQQTNKEDDPPSIFGGPRVPRDEPAHDK